jgi:hypothetical protein
MTTMDGVREKAARGARTTLAVVLAEVRFVLGTFARAFLRAGAVVSLLVLGLFVLGYGASIASGEAAESSFLEHVAVVLLAAGYALFVGAQGGLVVALPWTAWRLAGPWIVVPLVVIPLFVVVALLLCWPLISAAGAGTVDAIALAGGEHHWLVGDLGVAGRAGPLVLVLALPLLLIDLGAVMLAPSVLLHLLLLILALALALLLGLVPSGALSIVAITVGYVRRFVRRHAGVIAGETEAPPP